LLLKTTGSDARLNRLNSPAPIRSRAAEEGSFQIPIWGVPLVLLLLYVCLFSGLGALGLVGPDEPRYAAIARAMAETHDWVTPRLWGTPWFEKPVLYYWTAGMAMRLFGVSEFAARLPSALAALLAVIAVTWTALRSYGLGAAWYSLLMLPTSVAMIGFSRAASPDMLFAGLLTGAMAVAVEILQKPRPGPILRIAFGFFLGAAVLAKGPAGVVLAGGAALLWAALSRQWRAPFRFLHPLIIAVFCATALPWYVLCALRNPDFLRIFIWQHNFERYLTPVFQHPQPFWFYVPILAISSMPWIVMAASLFFKKWVTEEWEDSPGIIVFCWALFPLLFFSFSQSKLPGYILPSAPPALLLISRVVSRLFASDRRHSAVWIGITGAVFILIVSGSVKTLAMYGGLYDIPDSHLFAFLFLAGAGGLSAIVFSIMKKSVYAFAAMAIVVAALVAFLNAGILPSADSHFSARALARYSLQLNPSGKDIALYGLTRDWSYGLNYYFGRELPERMDGPVSSEWLFTSESNAMKLWHPGDQIYGIHNMSAPRVVLIHVASSGVNSR
jgi:4-amino-4-deoxy-L-arabinose transferase-like glycosyltransferase